MRANAWLLACALWALGGWGCDFTGDGRDEASSSSGDGSSAISSRGSATPRLSCMPPGEAWTRVQALYDTTQQSLHELITCGGLQLRVSSNIVTMLVASNEDLFKDEERALIDEFTRNPFAKNDEGVWTMALAESPGSSFALSFYEPGSGERIAQDVFDLDSYLAGVHVQSDVTFKQLTADAGAKHGFVFRWQAEGPLAHLMNGGQPLPDGFELQLSLADFVRSHAADFGPLSSVFALEVDSLVSYLDERDGTEVEYRVSGQRDQLAQIAEREVLGFEIERLEGRDEQLVMSGDTDDLRYVRTAELAGKIEYTVRGKVGGRSVDMRVTSDFGAGASYPQTRWSCP